MSNLDFNLATRMQIASGLERAVETGTLRGDTARGLATIFREVITIELHEEWHLIAAERLRDTKVKVRRGHSVDHLRELASEDKRTLYYLDGHWSGQGTAGAQDQCPVLEEIRAIGSGNPDDCIIIDDARYFAAAPPPPLDHHQWPTLMEVLDTLREQRPTRHLTVMGDQVFAIPRLIKPLLTGYAWTLEPSPTLGQRAIDALARARRRLTRHSLGYLDPKRS